MATIGSEFARQVVDFKSSKKISASMDPPFWDKLGGDPYSALNDIDVPITNEVIQRFQLQKLEQYAETEIAAQVAKHDAEELNLLFTSGKINSALSEMESKDEQSLNQVITNWISMLNEGYSYRKDTEYSEAEYNRMQNYLKRVCAKLEEIIGILSAHENKILGHYLSDLRDLLGQANISPADMTGWINHMTHLKGDTVEQIGKEWIKSKKIPALKSIHPIVTGALEYRGSEYEHQGQLIQDLMLLKIDNPDILNSVKISYTISGSPNDKKELSLGEFIKMLENLPHDAKHIMLTDYSYEQLMNYSALNVQAKAGINQLPWNKNKSTAIAITDFRDEYEAPMRISSLHAFNLLKSLNNLDSKEPYWILKDTSDTYQALANYGLATAITKILHLQADLGNQYLLTPSGFISFPERLRQLFKEQKYKIYMQGRISLKDELDKQHDVTLTGHD